MQKHLREAELRAKQVGENLRKHNFNIVEETNVM